MGISYYMCLLLKHNNLVEGLSKLGKYEYLGPYREHSHTLNGYSFIENTTISKIIQTLPKLIDSIGSSNPEVINKDFVAQCDLKRGEQSVTLCLSPALQEMYDVTLFGKYMLISIAYGPSRNMGFVPPNHPMASFLKDIILAFDPVYAWTEADFAINLFGGEQPFPTEKLPWYQLTGTQVLGESLITAIEKQKPLKDFDFQEMDWLSEKLLWLTWPSSVHAKEGYYYDAESKIFKRHYAASQSLFEILKTIPASILD